MFLSEIDLSRNNKPIMLVFTTRSCADCRAFMESWSEIDPTALSSLTAQFLSVLVLDDYQLEMTSFTPPEIDYLPRVLFANPDGTLRLDVANPEVEKSAPHYYETAQQVVAVMREVLARHREDIGTDVFTADLATDL